MANGEGLANTLIEHAPRIHDNYQIGIICALAIKKTTMGAIWRKGILKLKKEKGDDNEYTLVNIRVYNVVIACLPAGMMGNGHPVAKDMLRSFPIKSGLMVSVRGFGAGKLRRGCQPAHGHRRWGQMKLSKRQRANKARLQQRGSLTQQDAQGLQDERNALATCRILVETSEDEDPE